MYSENTTQELQEIITCQNEKISKLNRKLEEFDTVVSERNKLLEINKKIQQNNEYIINGHKKAFDELSAACNDQTEKLKKVSNAEYQWEFKYGKLEDDKNCITRQVNILKCNGNKLQSQLAEIKTSLKCVLKELCTTKSELEEKKSMVNKLETNLKCNEQELCNVRKELCNVCKDLEESKIECKKLNETNQILNSNLKCTKKSLCDAKLLATRMEERFTDDREMLTNELKISCEKINCLEIRYNEGMCKLNNERCKSKKFASKLIELNKMSVNNHLEMKNRIQVLQHDICGMNNELCCLKKKVIELQQENDCKCIEINGLNNKLYEKECQLKQMCLLSEKIERVKDYVEACCCPIKRCGPNPCCCPTNKCEPCCPKIKCETSPCCPKKKPDTICCKQENSTKDIKCTGGLSDKTKAVIQKYAAKSNKPNQDMYKTELKQLKCELEDLQQSINAIS